jgi:hypothetical protein
MPKVMHAVKLLTQEAANMTNNRQSICCSSTVLLP